MKTLNSSVSVAVLGWDVLVVMFASMRNSGSPVLLQQCCLWPSLSCQCLKCPFSVKCRNDVAVPDWDISAKLLGERERYFGSAVWAHVHMDSSVKQGLGKQKHQSRPNICFFCPVSGGSNHHGRKAPRGNKYCCWSMAEWPHYWPNSWVAKLHCIWCLGSGLRNEQSLRCMRWNRFQPTKYLETAISEWGRAQDWHAGVLLKPSSWHNPQLASCFSESVLTMLTRRDAEMLMLRPVPLTIHLMICEVEGKIQEKGSSRQFIGCFDL